MSVASDDEEVDLALLVFAERQDRQTVPFERFVSVFLTGEGLEVGQMVPWGDRFE